MHEAAALVMALGQPFEPLEPPANKCCQILFDSLARTAEEKRAPHYLMYHSIVASLKKALSVNFKKKSEYFRIDRLERRLRCG